MDCDDLANYIVQSCHADYSGVALKIQCCRLPSMRVLLVEDDPGLAAIIKTGFAEHGVQVVTVANYADGQMKALLGTFDVIILDVMLPGGSGFDLCRELRSRKVVTDRKSTRLNSSHPRLSRMPSSA